MSHLEQDPPDIQLETEVRLPCGCVLKHKIKQHSGLVPQPDSLVRAAGHLAYWVETRAKQHECALVSEDNPAGKRPFQTGVNKLFNEAFANEQRKAFFKNLQEIADKYMYDHLFPNLPLLAMDEKAIADNSTKPKTILESILDMRETAINQGIKPPFTVRISNNTWEELKAELGTDAVIEYRMKRGGCCLPDSRHEHCG